MITDGFRKYQRKRLDPYDGMAVDASTWADAHEYHRNRLMLHSIAMHQHGIVVGLDIIATTPPGRSITICPGMAVDQYGNTIVVAEKHPRRLEAEGTGLFYITLEYRETSEKTIRPQDMEKAKALHIEEVYSVEVQRETPSDTCVELARIAVDGKKAIIMDACDPFNPGANEIDTRYRCFAGPGCRGDVTLALWNSSGEVIHQEGISYLTRFIQLETHYQAFFKGSIEIGEKMPECDILYICGGADFSIDDVQHKALSEFLDQGGVILGEACDKGGDDAKMFRQAFAKMARSLKRNMKLVERGHPLLTLHHLFAQLPPGASGSALVMEDRGIIYSDSDYGCAWAGGKPDKPLPRDIIRSALEMGFNMTLYAYQRRHENQLKAPA